MCDCLVALWPATANRTTLFAKNSDRPPGEVQLVQRIEPHREPTTQTTYLEIEGHHDETIAFVGSRPEWMWGVEHGVNAAGVAAGNATIYTTLDPRGFAPALTGMDIVRLVLERSATADDAVALIELLLAKYGQGGSGHRDADRPYWNSFLVADATRAFVVETSGPAVAVEEVERVRATSNRTTIPWFDAEHRHPKKPVERLVDGRLHASNLVLSFEPVTVDALMNHLRSHVGGEDGYTVCMHVPDVEVTTASMVAELPNGAPPRAWFLTGSPCENGYARWDPSR